MTQGPRLPMGALFALLGAPAHAAEWPPVDAAAALPVLEAAWAEVHAGDSCDPASDRLAAAVRRAGPALIDAAIRPRVPPALSDTARLDALAATVAAFDVRCEASEPWGKARRMSTALGFPPLRQAELAPAGPNVTACRSWVDHMNGLACLGTRMHTEQVCPAGLDATPLDMTLYYGCLRTEMRCEGGTFAAGDPAVCADTLGLP